MALTAGVAWAPARGCRSGASSQAPLTRSSEHVDGATTVEPVTSRRSRVSATLLRSSQASVAHAGTAAQHALRGARHLAATRDALRPIAPQNSEPWMPTTARTPRSVAPGKRTTGPTAVSYQLHRKLHDSVESEAATSSRTHRQRAARALRPRHKSTPRVTGTATSNHSRSRSTVHNATQRRHTRQLPAPLRRGERAAGTADNVRRCTLHAARLRLPAAACTIMTTEPHTRIEAATLPRCTVVFRAGNDAAAGAKGKTTVTRDMVRHSLPRRRFARACVLPPAARPVRRDLICAVLISHRVRRDATPVVPSAEPCWRRGRGYFCVGGGGVRCLRPPSPPLSTRSHA